MFCFHNPSSNVIIEGIVQNSVLVSMVSIQWFLVVSFLCNQVLYSLGYKRTEGRHNSLLRFVILEKTNHFEDLSTLHCLNHDRLLQFQPKYQDRKYPVASSHNVYLKIERQTHDWHSLLCMFIPLSSYGFLMRSIQLYLIQLRNLKTFYFIMIYLVINYCWKNFLY